MRKLSRDEVLALSDNQLVNVVLTRLHYPNPQVVYRGPATLYVQTYKGQIVTLTVRDPLSWAEADPRYDLLEDGSLVVEDFQMELFTS